MSIGVWGMAARLYQAGRSGACREPAARPIVVHRARKPRRSEAAGGARQLVSLRGPIPSGPGYDGGGYGATGRQPPEHVIT